MTRNVPAGPSWILVTLCYRSQLFDQAFTDFFDRRARGLRVRCSSGEPRQAGLQLPVRAVGGQV
jgi:hypothetical protein